LGNGIEPQRILNNEGREHFIESALSDKALKLALARLFIGGKFGILTLLCYMSI
jgi:hypothetical protein